MDRLQVLLKPETIQKVKKIAKKKNTSASGYIRKVVEKEIKREKKKVSATEIFIKRASNAFKGGPSDLNQGFPLIARDQPATL